MPSETLSRSGINNNQKKRSAALFSRALYLHERHAVARRVDALASFFHVQAPVLLAVVVRKESKKVSKKGEKGRGKKQKKEPPLERTKAKKKKLSSRPFEPTFRTLKSDL